MSPLYQMAEKLLYKHGVDVEAAHLMAVLDLLPEQKLNTGHRLCTERDPSADMWILTAGSVSVIKRDYAGLEQEMARIQAPALLGHMALVTGNPRSATCNVVMPARLRVVTPERFVALLEDLSPQGDAFRRLLISSMSGQLDAGNRAIQNAISEPSAKNMTLAESSLHGWNE
ncbi:MAG: CRP-like cAMP-binding protein [Cognaticolwellia sp.]|jgi:CRP-like cAMP-binding protein